MMIFHIMLKAIKLTLRDKGYFLYMMIFPLALILVLGSVLQDAFSSDVELDKMTVEYTVQKDSPVGKAFGEFATEASGKQVTFKEADSAKAGKDAVANGDAVGFVDVKDDLTVTTNSPSQIEMSVLDGYLDGFTSQYRLASTIIKVDPMQASVLQNPPKASDSAIQVEKLASGNNISAFEYYAIAMIAMVMMFGINSGINVFREEKVRHTDVRLFIAPIKKSTAIIGNFLGAIFMQTVSLILLMVISDLFFGVHWGKYALVIFVIYFSLLFLSVAIGMAVDVFSNGNPAANGAATILIQVFAFLGGAYFPTGDGLMSKLSPIGWVRIGVRDVLYNHDVAAAVFPIGVNLLITAVLVVGMSLWIRRKEVY
ncbi:ABC transporter permease [Listeria cornellensis]|uniref:Multidrug ABC transporter permease n=1 Tax=Listeria cornellensis FSL F6-0969 TaxID=1265820 RepID=W7CI62_9LIST|nr:ABC transporter permease [Listeria cornellensis]EUJ32638.1 multidrug ABC transporter permease [Listeria cornellensis FSL F6-0969]